MRNSYRDRNMPRRHSRLLKTGRQNRKIDSLYFYPALRKLSTCLSQPWSDQHHNRRQHLLTLYTNWHCYLYLTNDNSKYTCPSSPRYCHFLGSQKVSCSRGLREQKVTLYKVAKHAAFCFVSTPARPKRNELRLKAEPSGGVPATGHKYQHPRKQHTSDGTQTTLTTQIRETVSILMQRADRTSSGRSPCTLRIGFLRRRVRGALHAAAVHEV